MTIRVFTLVAGLAAAGAVARAQTPQYQLHRDAIRGRATSDSGRAIAGAEVAITMAPDRTTQFAKTDSSGRYEIVFAQGTGDYLVHVAAPGFLAFRKRVTRTGADSVFVVDAVLKPAVQQLAAVQVQARRSRPSRDANPFGTNVGAAEQMAMGVNGMLSPDQRGSLDAIAGAMPGITAVPGGGVSVLGLAPSQNNATLNGLAFGGSNVPRAARTTSRVALSTYDPARGGFTGAQTQLILAPGNFLTNRRAFVTLDAPQLQTSDAVARRSGVPFTSLDLNLGGDGDLKLDRWFFNTGLELKRRLSDVTSLSEADADLLQHSGVARDSVAKLLSALGALGIPATVRGVPSSYVTDNVSFIGRVDRPIFDYKNFVPVNTSWGVLGYANWTRTGAMSLSPTVTAAHAGESQQLTAGAQALYSAYFGAERDRLTEFRTALSVLNGRSDPYLHLPDGRVLVASSFGATGGIASLGFGGNSAFDARNSSYTWQTTNETQFYWKNSPQHRAKVYTEARLDGFSRDAGGNRLGAFGFNSLEDVAANRPATFTRTLDVPTREGGEWTGVLAVSDLWRPTPRFNVQYGARVEGNAYTNSPANNPDVERLFGARTDETPNGWHVSPRAGFTWIYTSARSTGETQMYNQIGEFYRPPRGAIRGGIGEFHNFADPALLSDALVTTGLPGGVRRLSCVGSAVPTPDWRLYLDNAAAIPGQCLPQSAANPIPAFTDGAPNVVLFEKSYQPASTWRGNLAWTTAYRSMPFTVDAIYSVNRNQASIADLNFDGTPKFALASEGDRPVFVNSSSIVESTGTVSPLDARRALTFAQVLSRRSDLHSWGRQITVSAVPPLPMYLGLTYTVAQVRSQTRGFDGVSFGDPTVTHWSRGDYTPTHEVTVQTGLANGWLTTSLYGKFASGMPFTPMIGSDINGDGFANDAAFVFNSATVADTGLARGMRSLVASGSSRVKDCLGAQVGRAAERNSCVGPWTASLNASLSPGRRLTTFLHIPRRASVSLNLANPLGGLDALLHGDNLRGWGTPAFPDPVLYYVRGFDPASRAYRYEVNPRFGDTRASNTAFRTPFRLTLDVSIDLSRSPDEQQLDRWLKPGRQGYDGPKLDSVALVKRYFGNVPDWYQNILQEADSLLLSRDQVEALTAARARYMAKMTTHWGRVAAYMASLPDNYDPKDALKHQIDAVEGGWEVARLDAQEVLVTILTPVQLRLLPGTANMLYKAKEPIKGIRYFGAG